MCVACCCWPVVVGLLLMRSVAGVVCRWLLFVVVGCLLSIAVVAVRCALRVVCCLVCVMLVGVWCL